MRKDPIAGRLASIALLFACAKIDDAQAALRFVLVNQSGYDDSSVYIGFVGNELDATNAATGEPLALSQYQSEHWYTLDTLSSGIDLQSFIGGRIYIGYGQPWSFERAGYEPDPANPDDPNYFLRYDKIEITYTPGPADVADTTSIDYFSIPVELRTYEGGVGGTLVGSVTASPADAIVSALADATNPARAAIVESNNAFVRVIGPEKYPPPPGLPASPYDTFDTYLTYLQATYGPAHGNTVATVRGHFAGVANPSGPAEMAQDYDFTATVDASLDVTLSGSGTLVGSHSIVIRYGDLVAPTGIYGANPAIYFDGAQTSIYPQNDLYGWMVGDFLAGLNIGAVGSMVSDGNSGIVGELDSQQWFQLSTFFEALQPDCTVCYNRWAAAIAPQSQAYNFAYSDRFAPVTAPLNPQTVDTLELTFLSDGDLQGQGDAIFGNGFDD